MGRACFLNKVSFKWGRPGFGRGVPFLISVSIIDNWVKLTRKLTGGYFLALSYCFCVTCGWGCASVPDEGGLTGKAGAQRHQRQGQMRRKDSYQLLAQTLTSRANPHCDGEELAAEYPFHC